MFGRRHVACQSCLRKIRQLYLKHERQSSSSNEWTSKQIRQQFLDFFCNKHDHQFVKSSSIIPRKEEGIYFTNAGMNQFKPIFLGTVSKGSDLESYRRVANSQKCIRVGGKHNDLEDVGRDLTHHTFFEMLGSWSFGDYFKKEACGMALELLRDVYKLPLDRLYFTYFGGNPDLDLPPDLECREIWRELGIPSDRLLPFGMKDNFWDMGDTGPCGPCTEIHYDHVGGRNAAGLVNMDSPEVVEIWNLVFMQYNRLGPTKLLPLPSTHVDTGMGLERLCAVMRGTRCNYNTDLFSPMFELMHKETGVARYSDRCGIDGSQIVDTAYRILADHVRMATVCVADGLLPGRDSTEQKLRHVIYRALYQSHSVMKASPGLLSKLVQPVVESLGEAHPEIQQHAAKAVEVLDQTEEHYLHMYNEGQKNFNKLRKRQPNLTTLNAEELIKLQEGYYGRPMSMEFVEMIAGQHGLNIEVGLEELADSTQHVTMTTEVESPSFTAELINSLQAGNIPTTDDSAKYVYSSSQTGSYRFETLTSDIVSLVDDNNNLTDQVQQGCRVGVILTRTPFYAEGGGQVGDTGTIHTQTGSITVTDTQSSYGYVLHTGTVANGYIKPGQEATLNIDHDYRQGCMRNHTATHLVNAALRQVVGSDVCQRGSTVTPHKLTFTFSCLTKVTDSHIREIESLVKSWIADNTLVQQQLTPYKQAVAQGDVVYLENAIYPSEVFVVSVGSKEGTVNKSVSKEFCGGTHVLRTGDLGSFCVTNLTGSQTTLKVIECLTGELAAQAERQEDIVDKVAELRDKVKLDIDGLEDTLALQKHINFLLGTVVMSKVVKDEVVKQMDGIGTEINVLHNKQAFIKLTQDLETEMCDDRIDFIIQQFSIKVIPKLNKMMGKMTVKKPLILVVQTSNNVVAYVAVPKESSSVKLEEVVSMYCELSEAKVKSKEKNYTLVTGKNYELFLQAAERTRQHFSAGKVKSESSKQT